MDTEIIEEEHGYGTISIQCKKPPPDNKVENIKQHMQFMAREETELLQNTGINQQYDINSMILMNNSGQYMNLYD